MRIIPARGTQPAAVVLAQPGVGLLHLPAADPLLLVLLGSVYGDDEIDGIPGATYLVSGLIGYGVVATAFAGLAINLVLRRESGVLKRFRGRRCHRPSTSSP